MVCSVFSEFTVVSAMMLCMILFGWSALSQLKALENIFLCWETNK